MSSKFVTQMASMASLASPFFLLLLSLSAAATTRATPSGKIGVAYGRIADNLPQPSEVVKLLIREGVTDVKIYDTDPTVLDAFKDSGISLTVALPNDYLCQATDQSYTDDWVTNNILPFYPSTDITSIAVGNEVINQPADENLTSLLLPAMRNLHTSLQYYDLDDAIKISSPFPLDALDTSFPPSNGSFRCDLVDPLINPLLDFLDETSSFMMFNVYPFIAYSEHPDQTPLDYALFAPTAQGFTDPNTGLHYSNLFDAQVDAVYSAMSSLEADRDSRRQLDRTRTNAVGETKNRRDNRARRGPRSKITETGWAHIDARRNKNLLANGDGNDTPPPPPSSSLVYGATKANSANYNRNLIKRVLTGGGTPLNPDEPLEVYIFSLFNEDKKPGPESERNYGLFYPNGQKVYDISLSTPEQLPTTIFCVAKEGADTNNLKKGLDYACGGIDCRPIQSGGACFQPNTVEAHASWAFNRFYQIKSRAGATCDFGGVATLTSEQPDHRKFCVSSAIS